MVQEERIEEEEEIQTPQAVQPLAFVAPVEAEGGGGEVKEEVPVGGDPREELSDITSLDDFDRDWLFGTGGVTETEEEDDVSDLVEVDREDIVGAPPAEPVKRYRVAPRGRREVRQNPPTSMGGVQL